MPVNGVPSDQWRVERALGPYAEPMDELELLEEQKLIKLKRSVSYTHLTLPTNREV